MGILFGARLLAIARDSKNRDPQLVRAWRARLISPSDWGSGAADLKCDFHLRSAR